MKLSQLKTELAALKKEGQSAIDAADAKSLAVGKVAVLSLAGNLKALIKRKKDSRSWFGKLLDGLLENVRQAICCHGYTEIDEEGEREKLADKLLQAVLKAIPPPYNIVAKLLLKKTIRKAIRKVLDYLAGQGDKMCEGVACTLSPLVIK